MSFTKTIQNAFDKLLIEHAKLARAADIRVSVCRGKWPDQKDGNRHDSDCQDCRELIKLAQAVGPSPYETYPKEAFRKLAEIEQKATKEA